MAGHKIGEEPVSRSKIIRTLEKELKYSRFVHSLGVAYTATSLAMRYGADLEKAELAGLLHDCAKYLSDKEYLSLCHEREIPVSAAEAANPSLLHAKAGAVLAAEKYGVTDPEILEAIRNHTTGKPAMSMLDKIIYIADYIEPGRNQAPNLAIVRQLAFEDLDRALIKILSDTLSYLEESGAEIDPMTRETYLYYEMCQVVS